jgi:hypothetical protein
MIDFRKLLPSNQKGKPSEDIIKGVQGVLQDLVDDRASLLKNSIRLPGMVIENAVNYSERMGYKFNTGDGYTSELSYFKKEVGTLVNRLQAKCADIAYEKIIYIYNLEGSVYPLLIFDAINTTIFMEPWINWLDFTGVINDDAQLLDNGYNDDGSNPVFPTDPSRMLDNDQDNFGNLLVGSLVDYLDNPFPYYGISTRHLLVSYEPLTRRSDGKRVAEGYNYVMSNDSAKSLYSNVNQFSRLIEVPHFEFRLKMVVGNPGTNHTIDYITEAGNAHSPAVQMFTRLFSGRDMATIEKIQFGSGQHTDADITAETITGCLTPIDTTSTGVLNDGSPNFRTTVTDYNLGALSTDLVQMRNYITVAMKWFNFTEICFFDNSNNVIVYSKFPQVRFYSEMYSSVYLEVAKV